MLTAAIVVLVLIPAPSPLHARGQSEPEPSAADPAESRPGIDRAAPSDAPPSDAPGDAPEDPPSEKPTDANDAEERSHGELVTCASPSCADPVDMETIVQGSTGGVTEERYEVIRDVERFHAVWQELHRNRLEPPEPPSVDFTKHVVIAAFLGRKSTGGYAVEIVEICRDDTTDAPVIRVTRRSPDPDAMVTQALTAPFHLVRTTALPDGARFCEAPHE